MAVTNIQQLKDLAKNIRRNVLISLTEAGSGHTGGSLGLADVFTVLYFNIMNHDPGNPGNPGKTQLYGGKYEIVPVFPCLHPVN